MNKNLLTVLGLPLLVVMLAVAGFVGFTWWDRGAPPGMQPPVHDVALADLNRNHRGVRVSGTAHLTVKLVQRSGEDHWYLFPLFEKGDTEGRHIAVMVRTQRRPKDLYSFEDLTLEGLARPPGTLLPRSTQEQYLSRGYTFAEDFVLVEDFREPEPSGEAPTRQE